ncbi:MAG: hypothetical protein ACTSW1_18825 [Candidatus Hodarchaeales archaeon]
MTIKINLDTQKERKFREKAMKKFGYRKGALKKALEEAIDLWLTTDGGDIPEVSNPTQELEGILEGLQESSVELQHIGSKLFIKE